MQKIRKILRAVSEKTALPTNQPIITNNNDLIGPRWRRSKKNFFGLIFPFNEKMNMTVSGFP